MPLRQPPDGDVDERDEVLQLLASLKEALPKLEVASPIPAA